MTYVDARDDFNLSIVFTVDTRMANRVPAADWLGTNCKHHSRSTVTEPNTTLCTCVSVMSGTPFCHDDATKSILSS